MRRYYDTLIKTKHPVFDNTITWGAGGLDVDYQLLPNVPYQREIDYATSLGLDAYKHVPFIQRIGDDIVITWQEGLTDEDVAGQSIKMKYLSYDKTLSTKYEVIPSFSDTESGDIIYTINNGMIDVEGTWYYLATVVNKTSNLTYENIPIGIIASERTSSTTVGTPFWVHTPSGVAPTPESGYDAYTFNEPVSGKIRNKMRGDSFQLFAYPQDREFGGALENGANEFLEVSAIKRNDTFVRVSRLFNGSAPEYNYVYFDFGDGNPVISNVPMSPVRTTIGLLRDGRIALVGCNGTGLDYRDSIFIAIADLDTLNFRSENVYRVVYGQDSGQEYEGDFKNGIWAYPHFIHDSDNKIKIVCTKYKEGVFYLEIDYTDIQVFT